jgi:GntR family transcriptional regulator, transcriptional repressor for pyruvate dehydrogenase complex
LSAAPLREPGARPDTDRRRSQLSQPRVAEIVADILRARIVDGALEDGSFLPKQDDLIAEFGVSRPSIREAMRILETEGLVSVRRGNMGGAEVHAPKAGPAAHLLGLVMQSKHVTLLDLATALQILEPACAALCAARDDRAEAVLPALESANRDAARALDDGVAFTGAVRRWHDELVGSCGNATMILLVGTLEAIWSRHVREWARHFSPDDPYPDDWQPQPVLDAHVRITELIAAGDVEGANRATTRHLEGSRAYLMARDPERAVNVTETQRPLGRF